MLKMKKNEATITSEIWKILDKNPTISRNLSENLINIRALARYIIKEKKINATTDAIISAIRRYKPDHYDNIFENAQRVMDNAITISTKSKLAIITVIKDPKVQKALPELFSIIHYNQGGVLRIIQAEESIKMIIDEKNLEKVKNIFLDEQIIEIDKDLVEINIHQHPEGKYTPGSLALTATELAINDINIIEVSGCFPECLWILDEKDLVKAYNIIYKLWEPKTN